MEKRQPRQPLARGRASGHSAGKEKAIDELIKKDPEKAAQILREILSGKK